MILSRLIRTLRWLSACRFRPAVWAASRSSRVSSACWRWTGRNSAVVWKSGQVRQALGCGQSCWGGRPQYPFGRVSAARDSRCLTHSALRSQPAGRSRGADLRGRLGSGSSVQTRPGSSCRACARRRPSWLGWRGRAGVG